MIVAKQILNTVYMYVYLVYYTERIRWDRKFMIAELLKVNRDRVLSKREQHKREMNWKS